MQGRCCPSVKVGLSGKRLICSELEWNIFGISEEALCWSRSGDDLQNPDREGRVEFRSSSDDEAG
jgi:hypothetical protein